MHACIAAVSQNVPAVPMAYSDKFVGVMQTVGIESNVVDLRKMNEEEILSVIGWAYEQRGVVRQQLAQTMPQVRETVLNLFEDMENSGSRTHAPSTAGGVAMGV
jgi:colanic acid/amylovoran biosynthesis protein